VNVELTVTHAARPRRPVLEDESHKCRACSSVCSRVPLVVQLQDFTAICAVCSISHLHDSA